MRGVAIIKAAQVAMMLLAPAFAWAADGRALYHGHTAFAAGAASTANRLPVEFAACARCHGALGEGGIEGAVVVPPLQLAALLAPRDGKPGYRDAQALRAAIAMGIGRDGRAMGPTMPRYTLADPEIVALLAYLGRLGGADDVAAGVSAHVVRLGTALPLSGPATLVGRAVHAGLQARFTVANARGGIHGRRIELYVEDIVPQGAGAAVTRLREQPVYAVVGGLWGMQEADVRLAETRVAHIGTLVQRARVSDAGPWVADLLASLAGQQIALARAVQFCAEPVRWAIRQGPVEADADASVTRWFANDTALVAALRGGMVPAQACVGLGLGQIGMVLPDAWSRLVVLPFPTDLTRPDATGQIPDIWHALGQAAGALVLEALARAGPGLHERALLDAVATISGFAPLPGAPLFFTRHRRHGWDAAIMTFPRSRAGPLSTSEANPCTSSHTC